VADRRAGPGHQPELGLDPLRRRSCRRSLKRVGSHSPRPLCARREPDSPPSRPRTWHSDSGCAGEKPSPAAGRAAERLPQPRVLLAKAILPYHGANGHGTGRLRAPLGSKVPSPFRRASIGSESGAGRRCGERAGSSSLSRVYIPGVYTRHGPRRLAEDRARVVAGGVTTPRS